ncbi:MAG: acyl-[acyl-carrier-protein]-phospholipid O-acyltransferase /LCFA-[acyl-carrier-protein] ligase [Verrucomicrobia bacterium]|nr:MAG: acyl-[acyl-carrier-protein]-phospholipid O-acyltransferase /LCFA-[acyl-carrier-protein] ligase [Verrucomicrobiota bacterium]
MRTMSSNGADPATNPGMHETAETAPDWKSLWAMLLLQAQTVFNTKVAQFTLIGLAGVIAGKLVQDNPSVQGTQAYHSLKNAEQVLFAISSATFLLIAPLSGWVADRFSKRSVLIGCLWTQSFALAWITACLYFRQFWLGAIGFCLIEIQATLANPAKFGICKELVGSTGLSRAVGLLQMLIVVSIITGTVVGGQAFAALSPLKGDWQAAIYVVAGLLAATVVQFLLGFLIQRTPVQSREPFHPGLLWCHFERIAEVWSHQIFRHPALGAAYFSFAAQVTSLGLILVGKEIYPLPGEATAKSAILVGLVGIGNAVGSLVVALICRKRIILGTVAVGGLGMAAGLAAVASLNLATSPPPLYFGSVGTIGFFAALFLVPLYSFIQEKAEPERRGRITSTVNIMNSMAGLAGIGFVAALGFFKLDSHFIFTVLSGMTLLVGFIIIAILRTVPRP